MEDYKKFVSKLDVKETVFIPISALVGDNVVEKSDRMSWYKGKNLLHYLEEVQIESTNGLNFARFPVQWVIRPGNNGYHDYRGYAGKVISGVFKKGDDVFVMPSGFNQLLNQLKYLGKMLKKLLLQCRLFFI